MSKRKICLIGALAFLLPFLTSTGKLLWQIAHPNFTLFCSYNLKSLWIVSRKVSISQRLPFPPPLPTVKQAINISHFLTPEESSYLGLPELEGAYMDFPISFLCINDPKFLLKEAMVMQGLDYEPSYLWHPDARTLAYCPYCRLAVLLDGKLEKR